MSQIQNNQFIDKFKWLKTEDAKINNLRTRVTQVLNRLLPARILSKYNIFNLTLDLSQDFTNMMMVYTENSLIESNLLTAQNESSVRGLAEVTGHKATRPISSRGVLRCTFKPGIQLITPKIILSNTVFLNVVNQLQYTASIVGGVREISTTLSAFDVELIEGQLKTMTYVTNGDPLYKIELDDTNAIENYDIAVTVNGTPYKKYDSLYDMGTTTEGFITKNGFGNQVDIIFGDNVHGKQLSEGDTVTVQYRITNGEAGNLDGNEEFNIISEVYDASGNSIDVSEHISMSIVSGFQLGSNGETVELTKALAGHNSRANVLLRPENLKAYLSRLTMLSQINVWTNDDDLVFNMLLLPNLSNKLKQYSDYLYMTDDDLKLSDSVKTDIKNMINASKRQATSSEVVIHDPVFKRYAMFIYIDAVVNDRDELRNTILDKISEIMVEQTFKETSLVISKPEVSKSAIVDVIYDLPQIRSVSIDTISEVNENARINGYHDYTVTEYVGSVKQTKTVRKDIPSTVNPNIGFTELGNLVPENTREVPVLRSGFKRYVDATTTIDITKPVYIFYKNSNSTWDEL